jgi:hypothetical protein
MRMTFKVTRGSWGQQVRGAVAGGQDCGGGVQR